MAMPSASVTSAAVGALSIDQPTTRREYCVEHDRAVHLALTRGVLGDVGDPQLVGTLRAKFRSTRSATVASGRKPRRPLGLPVTARRPARRISRHTGDSRP